MPKTMNYLGIARKSGNIELGEENVKTLVKAGKARLVLLARDASEGVTQRVGGYVFGFHAPVVTLPYTKTELGGALGRAQCAVCALRDLGLARSLAEALAAEHGEAYAGAAEALGKTQARITARKTARGSKTGKRRKRNEQL